VQGLPLKNTTRGMWAGRRESRDFFTSRCSEPLNLSIPQARNFVLCLSITNLQSMKYQKSLTDLEQEFKKNSIDFSSVVGSWKKRVFGIT
jgi:hypothetical protein